MKVERCRYVRWQSSCVSVMASSAQGRVCVCYDDGVSELLVDMVAVRRIYGRRDVVAQCVRFCDDDGKKIFAATINGAIFRLNFDSLSLGTPVDSGGGAVWALAGELLAGCEDGTVREFTRDLSYSSRRVVVNGGRCVSMCENYVGGDDGSIRCLDDGQDLCPARGDCVIWSLAIARSENRALVVSGDSKGRVRTWDPVSRVALSEFRRHEADVLALVSVDDYVFASGVDSKVVSFRMTEGDLAPGKSYRAHSSDVCSLCIVDEKLIAGSSTESKICSFDFRSMKDVKKHFAYPRLVSAFKNLIALSTRSDVIEVWKPLDCLLRIRSARSNFCALAVCERAVAASDSSSTRILSFDEERPEILLKPSSAIAFVRDGRVVVLCHSSEIVSYTLDFEQGSATSASPSSGQTPPQQLLGASSTLIATPTSHIKFPSHVTSICVEGNSVYALATAQSLVHRFDSDAMTLETNPSPVAHPVGFSPPRLLYSRTHLVLDGQISTRYGPILAATLDDDDEDALRIFELPLRNNSHRYPPIKRKRFGA